MRNIKLTIEYDGKRYLGWQRLGDSEKTIQGKIESVIAQMTGEKSRSLDLVERMRALMPEVRSRILKQIQKWPAVKCCHSLIAICQGTSL